MMNMTTRQVKIIHTTHAAMTMATMIPGSRGVATVVGTGLEGDGEGVMLDVVDEGSSAPVYKRNICYFSTSCIKYVRMYA